MMTTYMLIWIKTFIIFLTFTLFVSHKLIAQKVNIALALLDSDTTQLYYCDSTDYFTIDKPIYILCSSLDTPQAVIETTTILLDTIFDKSVYDKNPMPFDPITMPNRILIPKVVSLPCRGHGAIQLDNQIHSYNYFLIENHTSIFISDTLISNFLKHVNIPFTSEDGYEKNGYGEKWVLYLENKTTVNIYILTFMLKDEEYLRSYILIETQDGIVFRWI